MREKSLEQTVWAAPVSGLREVILSDNFTLLATQDTGEYAAVEVMLQNAFKYYVSIKWQVGLMAELL